MFLSYRHHHWSVWTSGRNAKDHSFAGNYSTFVHLSKKGGRDRTSCGGCNSTGITSSGTSIVMSTWRSCCRWVRRRASMRLCRCSCCCCWRRIRWVVVDMWKKKKQLGGMNDYPITSGPPELSREFSLWKFPIAPPVWLKRVVVVVVL